MWATCGSRFYVRVNSWCDVINILLLSLKVSFDSFVFSLLIKFVSIFERPENILSEEKLPVCGCAQSHMYKVAYVLPLISELFIRVCVCVCVCVCVLIVVSMVMRWDTTPGGGGVGWGTHSTNYHTGTCRKHGSQFRPFGISMTPYFFRFGGIRVGGKSLLVYQWGLITFWYINGS